jgi:flagellin-specific chaperone FliS
MMKNAYGTKAYRNQDVMGASPIRLVVMTFDLAIQACEGKEFIRASKVVSHLRDSLNFDHGDAALGFFRLYQWCLDCIRKEDYESALKVLYELRETWVTIENQMASAPAPSVEAMIPAYVNSV